jgi:hypothetical protein
VDTSTGIRTSCGGEGSGEGGCSRSLSRFGRTDLSEPDFKESIAAIAASSSGTKVSSGFSSESTLKIEFCFLGGEELGDTTWALPAIDLGGDVPLVDFWASSKDLCDSNEMQVKIGSPDDCDGGDDTDTGTGGRRDSSLTTQSFAFLGAGWERVNVLATGG